jgi:GntR family transcriptional regulator
LRQFAASDEYTNGKILPKETELAEKFNISRNTLRQAINRLVFEGVFIRKRRYGTVAAPAVMLSNARNWMSFSQEMKARGYEVGNFELHVSWKVPEASY